MLVSIVITSFNYAAYIRGTVESALAQTHPDVEVICVDDGSTDASPAILASFGDRITTILKPNGGQGSAMNAGFAASRGEVVLFLDSDDLLDPLCAASVSDHWKDAFSSLHFGIAFIDGQGRATEPPARSSLASEFPSGDLKERALGHGGIGHPPTTANAFSRRFLARVMPMPEADWRTHPDVYLCFLAALHGEVGRIDQVLCSYRLHQSAGSTTIDGRVAPDRLRRFVTLRLAADRALRREAVTLGLAMGVEPIERRPFFLKDLLAWRKLQPDAPAGGGELLCLPLAGIWRRLVRETVRSSSLGISRKAFYLAWSSAVAVAPRGAAERLIRLTRT